MALSMQSCQKEEKESKLIKVETITIGSDASATSTDFPGRVKASEEVNMAFKESENWQGCKVNLAQMVLRVK